MDVQGQGVGSNVPTLFLGPQHSLMSIFWPHLDDKSEEDAIPSSYDLILLWGQMACLKNGRKVLNNIKNVLSLGSIFKLRIFLYRCPQSCC